MYEITLKDIAKKANCSVNTASLALKGSTRISESTRVKVQEIAKELNYISNNLARTLVLKKSRTVGLILRNISSLQLTTIARYIEQYLEQKGYSLYIIATHDNSEIEKKAINLMLSNMVDGLIINTSMTDNIAQLEQLRANGLPIVMISGFDKLPTIDCVYPDLVNGSFMATRHLLSMNHKRVVFISSGTMDNNVYERKIIGFKKALEAADISFTPDMLCSIGNTGFNYLEDVSLSILLHKAKSETAFIISEDELAIPILKYLCKNGVSIPSDLAIASIDNIRYAESSIVSLTSAGFDQQYISHRAVDILVDIIDGKRRKEDCEYISVKPDFYIRESCGYTKFNC